MSESEMTTETPEREGDCSPAICYAMSNEDLRLAITLVRDLMGRSGSKTETWRKLEAHYWRLLEIQSVRAEGLFEA